MLNHNIFRPKFQDEHETSYSRLLPNTQDYFEFEKNRATIQKQAKKATERCHSRQIKKHLKRKQPSVYELNEKVLVRYRNRKHKVPKRYKVVQGTVIARNLKLNRYTVRFRDSDGSKCDWYSVIDLTSVTRETESRHRTAIQRRLSQQKQRER